MQKKNLFVKYLQFYISQKKLSDFDHKWPKTRQLLFKIFWYSYFHSLTYRAMCSNLYLQQETLEKFCKLLMGIKCMHINLSCACECDIMWIRKKVVIFFRNNDFYKLNIECACWLQVKVLKWCLRKSFEIWNISRDNPWFLTT